MSSLDELLGIMARLRDPDGGCPWDLEQDFASISPHTIEEAYEVDEAIASGDREALRDELGDLLFQVVFQARLAEEEGAFDFWGVVAAIVDKLVRRHPHVFAGAEVPSTIEGQRASWEDIKAAERAAAGKDSPGPPDLFAGIPRSLPALSRSMKIASRIERLASEAGSAPQNASRGADRADPSGAVRSSLDAITDASKSLEDSASGSDLARAVGQGLRAWVQLARALGVDAEQALRQVDDEAVARIRANQRQASRAQVR
jgi:nucleoside triphosphate diphosphatase